MAALDKNRETPNLLPRSLGEGLEEARIRASEPMSVDEANSVIDSDRERAAESRHGWQAAKQVGATVIALAGIGWAGNHILHNANPKIVQKTHVEQLPDYAHGPDAVRNVTITTQTPEYNK